MRRWLPRYVVPTLAAAMAVGGIAAGLSDARVATATCHNLTASIVGTAQGDRLVGTQYGDVVAAKNGDDTVFGNGGHDDICLGKGNDIAEADLDPQVVDDAYPEVWILGEQGNDTITADRSGVPMPGRGHYDGGIGDDVITGFGELFGGKGVDILTGDTGWSSLPNLGGDTLHGGDDGDLLIGDPPDGYPAGDDDDRLYGDAGDDNLNGGGGDDLLEGGSGTDFADGGPGTDTCHAEIEVNCERN